jgi:hypothetical protein
LGHFFAHWAIENFGKFFENKNSKKKNTNFWVTFITERNCALILTKMASATFWAIFFQTHLVTLVTMHSNIAGEA